MPKPPIDPDSFDKINFVIDSWTTGCDAPWYIYIETMKPAALTAFIALITFGMGDVVRGALRPKGLSGRTGKRKGKWVRKIPNFPEIGNLIGHHLPIAEQISDFTRWGTLTKTLWRIDTAMQAALFLWLVADIAEDFVFNWTSLLYESYWCLPDPPGGFSMRNPPTPNKASYIWWTEAFGVTDYMRPMPSFGFKTGRTGAKGATVAAGVTFTKSGMLDPPTECKVAIVDWPGGNIVEEVSSTTPDDDGIYRIPIKHTFARDTQFRVVTWHAPSWALVGNSCVVGKELEG